MQVAIEPLIFELFQKNKEEENLAADVQLSPDSSITDYHSHEHPTTCTRQPYVTGVSCRQ